MKDGTNVVKLNKFSKYKCKEEVKSFEDTYSFRFSDVMGKKGGQSSSVNAPCPLGLRSKKRFEVGWRGLFDCPDERRVIDDDDNYINAKGWTNTSQ